MAVRPTFNLKHFEQIAASMMNAMASLQGAITDYNIGSVNRSLLEAVAMELEELYYRMFAAVEEAIPAGVYEAFGFSALPSRTSVGTVVFTRSTIAAQNYVVPAGTAVATADGIRFVTTDQVTLLTGNTEVSAQIVCEEAGIAGNVGANSITALTSALLGIEGVTNSVGTFGGADAESADEQKLRFASFILSLARAPISGIESGAKTAVITDVNTGSIVEQVQFAKVVEPYLTDPGEPVGMVTLYIDNGSGSASQALIDQVRNVINGYVDNTGARVTGYKAAGIIVNVISVTLFTQNISAIVTLDIGASQAVVDTAIRDAIDTVFSNLDVSEGLDWATLLTAIMVVSGVNTITLSTPSEDVGGQIGKRMRPGTVTLTYV